VAVLVLGELLEAALDDVGQPDALGDDAVGGDAPVAEPSGTSRP
jgi:hypothetical protein